MRNSLVIALVIFCAGCSGNEPRRFPVVPVRVEVYSSGKPAVNARLFLHPLKEEEDPQRFRRVRPHGVAGDDGGVTFTSYLSNDGAPEGEYAVIVIWPKKGRQPVSDNEDGPPDRFEGKFSDPASTPLRLVVTRDGAEPARIVIP